MIIFKWLCIAIAGAAPFAAVASLIGMFYGLGGWGWLLFLWFGFTGMFSMGAAKQFESNCGVTTFSAVILLTAFVAGAFFALSEFPRQVSVFYALLAPLLFLPLFAFKKSGQTR